MPPLQPLPTMFYQQYSKWIWVAGSSLFLTSFVSDENFWGIPSKWQTFVKHLQDNLPVTQQKCQSTEGKTKQWIQLVSVAWFRPFFTYYGLLNERKALQCQYYKVQWQEMPQYNTWNVLNRMQNNTSNTNLTS